MENNSFVKNISKGILNRLNLISPSPEQDLKVSWFRTKYYKHLPAGKIRTHRLLGKDLYFYNPAELLHGLDEIFVQEIYKQNLPSKPFIIDCGANIGLSVIYIKHHYPAAEIIAFEPDEINFDLLRRNIKSFGYDDIKLCKEAVWIEDTHLYFSNEGAMHSMIELEEKSNTVSVKATQLKKLLTRNIDFLKIDIEGAEYQVIKDCDQQLSCVNNLFIEYHGFFNSINELVEISEILRDNGFQFYIKEAANIYNYPFIREKKKGNFDIQLNIFCFRP